MYITILSIKTKPVKHCVQASFAFGALVGFEKSKAMQHPKRCYELLLQTTRNTSQPTNPWVVERLWVMMFAGHDYVDT